MVTPSLCFWPFIFGALEPKYSPFYPEGDYLLQPLMAAENDYLLVTVEIVSECVKQLWGPDASVSRGNTLVHTSTTLIRVFTPRTIVAMDLKR